MTTIAIGALGWLLALIGALAPGDLFNPAAPGWASWAHDVGLLVMGCALYRALILHEP